MMRFKGFGFRFMLIFLEIYSGWWFFLGVFVPHNTDTIMLHKPLKNQLVIIIIGQHAIMSIGSRLAPIEEFSHQRICLEEFSHEVVPASTCACSYRRAHLVVGDFGCLNGCMGQSRISMEEFRSIVVFEDGITPKRMSANIQAYESMLILGCWGSGNI